MVSPFACYMIHLFSFVQYLYVCAAGHETTAAVLTWTLFNLAQNPELTARIQSEIDTVMGADGLPSFDDLPALQLTRLALVSTKHI